MTKSELFKTAHRIARSIAAPGISYRATFGLALRELNGAKTVQTRNFTIVRTLDVDYRKDGEISFAKAIVLTDAGDITVTVSSRKGDTDNAIRIAGHDLVVGGASLRAVEAAIAKAAKTATPDLPALEGVSEAQVAFATKVRAGRFKAFLDYLSIARQGAETEAEVEFADGIEREIKGRTDASFWLDTRYMVPEDVVLRIADELR